MWRSNGDRKISCTQSVSTDGVQGSGESNSPTISADGSLILFRSPAGELTPGDTRNWDVFLHDVDAGTTVRISVAPAGVEADDSSYSPQISVDGRYVVFASMAGNLVAGDTNGVMDVFLHDLETGITTRFTELAGVSQGDGASANPAVSAAGDVLAFQSSAANLVAGDLNGKGDVFLVSRLAPTYDPDIP